MQPIPTADQIRLWDSYTIDNEPVASDALMERAARAFCDWFIAQQGVSSPVFVLCGTGNNGGDGLAIARILHYYFSEVRIVICRISPTESADFKAKWAELPPRSGIIVNELTENDDFPPIPDNAVIIDAMLGTGISRVVAGYWARFFHHLNSLDNKVIAVDMPSGLFPDKSMLDLEATQSAGEKVFHPAVKADAVVTFEAPKLALLMAENQPFVRDFVVLPIGLHPDFWQKTTPTHFFLTPNFIKKTLKNRSRHAHKGTFGHALLVVGSFGMAGAAVLAAQACMRAGAGLLTVQTPQCNRIILQTTLPEALVRADADEFVISQNSDVSSFDAVGIGCGIGKAGRTAAALKNYLFSVKKPIVLDADALNLIADNPDMLNALPEGAILTPHPKEFERLFGKTKNDFERLEILKISAKSLKVNIILKGAFTAVADTEGGLYFNPTGNAGMATAGSGDVLTGIVTGLLAQGYAPLAAAQLGVFLHGLAGDLAAENMGQEALLASDIVGHLGAAFLALRK